VQAGKVLDLEAGIEGGQETEEEGYRKQEDSERECAVTPVDEEEGESEEQAQEGLGLVGVDGQGVVGGREHFGERDEVKKESGDGGGDGEMTPAGTVVEGRRQDRERGDAVEEDRDSKPKERHMG